MQEELVIDQDIDEQLIYMALFIDKKELGVAIYDVTTTHLQTIQLQVTNEMELYEKIERLLTQFQVHNVIISIRNANTYKLLHIIKELNRKGHRTTEISVSKHADFSYVKACKAIKQIHVASQRSSYFDTNSKYTTNDAGRYIGSLINFENVQLVRAIGALITFILSEKIGHQLEDITAITFACIENTALDGILSIDTNVLCSLQIFTNELHPSLVKKSGRSKEGFSLFGLLNRTSTRSGFHILKQWMLAPLTDLRQVNDRLDLVDFFAQTENRELCDALRAALKTFSDVGSIFRRIKNRSASVGDWCRLYTSIQAFLLIQSNVGKYQHITLDNAVATFIQGILTQTVSHASNLLINVIDFEESQAEDMVIVRAGVSSILDTARENYEDLDNVLTEVAYQIQERNPSLLSLTVQYIPQVGYVICCDTPTNIPKFEFQFQEDESTFYYKDDNCRDLDCSIGDIFGFILDIQRELLEELTVALHEHETNIHDMVEIVGHLDCLLCFAESACNYNFKRPVLTEHNILRATQARHPLQELLVDNYIANDIFWGSVGKSGRIKLISGENGAGKSCYLKLVGILQYMCQIGCFVPAEDAEIGLVDKIFTRVQSMESAVISESSFTIDCTQVAWMLNHGTKRSLFLIDEFGKGTSPLDGVSLLSATINYLVYQINNGAEIRAIITTHMLEIFRNELCGNPLTILSNEEQDSIVLWTRMASAASEVETDPFAVCPLYEIQVGSATHSNALGCALSHGIPRKIIDRAQDILKSRNEGRPIKKLIPEKELVSVERIEKELLSLFASFDWENAKDEEISKLLLVARLSEQE